MCIQLGIYCFGLGMATIELTQGDKPGARLSEPLDSQRVQCEERSVYVSANRNAPLVSDRKFKISFYFT